MNALTTVRRAATRRRTAEHNYREALRAARAAGHTYQAIGDAAGISLMGAKYLIVGDPRHNQP